MNNTSSIRHAPHDTIWGMFVESVDAKLIAFFTKISVPAARIGLFIIFFWFGILKILGLSPAADLVRALFEETLRYPSFDVFYMLFGFFEVLIGTLFLIPWAVRAVIPILLMHMIMTFLPLVFLPDIAWQQTFVPTLEGQYIIKNIAIIVTAIFVVAHTHPLSQKNG